jgi:hypothetical protein
VKPFLVCKYIAVAWLLLTFSPHVTDDLWDLNVRDRCATVINIFNAVWEPLLRAAHLEKRADLAAAASASYGAGGDNVKVEPRGTAAAPSPRDTLSIFLPLVRAFGLSFGLGSLLKLLHDVLVFASPILLQKIIQFR